MSEEEIKRLENTINENKDYREHFHLHDYFEVEYIDKLVTSYKQIQQENQKYKEVIDKAIKYVNENVYKENNGCGYEWWEINSKDDLLNILRGDSNE